MKTRKYGRDAAGRREFVKASLAGVVGVAGSNLGSVEVPATAAQSSEFAWPALTSECRPWTFWWWMGSAVDEQNVSALLKSYRDAGVGGVHVIPIYGARGHENRYINFLSLRWVEILAHTVAEARRLGMNADVTTGTGWPFGGPQIDDAAAAATALFEKYSAPAGTVLERLVRSAKQPNASLQALVAYSAAGQVLDLTGKVDATGRLDWVAPAGDWTLYAVFAGLTKQAVKRAAPGGEGSVVDHFSEAALRKYLARFDQAFAGKNVPVRALYNDSYEVYGADWTGDFFAEFERRRGYDLKRHLPALHGGGDAGARVLCDYRETVADLLLERFVRPWAAWGRARGHSTRNQAHGAPGNLLDLYAAADTPETEAFGPSGFKIPGLRVDRNIPEHFGKPDTLFNKFASSAAHLAGRRLVSSESCTWLGEHFQVSLSQIKPELDRLFAAGVNHIFYHGMTYSPAQVPFPGWLFYASTNFGPAGGFWRDLPLLNAYVARCQSVLQQGTPDNDVLLYFPVHELWQTARGGGGDRPLLRQFTAHNVESWIVKEIGGWGACAEELHRRGYAFDYVSDRLLRDVRVPAAGAPVAGGGQAHYRAVVVAGCRVMPLQTLERLIELAAGGATVVFKDGLPADVPGLHDLAGRRERLRKLLANLKSIRANHAAREYAVGAGRILVGGRLEAVLRTAGVRREALADHGLSFVRRAHRAGHHYFVANLGDKSFEGWVALGVRARSVVVLDSRSAEVGLAAVRAGANGAAEVFLQLPPGQSLILRSFASRAVKGPRWKYLAPAGAPFVIAGTWEVTFLEGGPTLPAELKTDKLVSWTELGGADAKAFSGTARYKIDFERPAGRADEWVLDGGTICESARVRLNGQDAGALWSFPLQINVGRLLRPGRNTLEIEVTNLSANRIADMARRGVKWADFHDINFVNIKYKPFDASGWEPMPSGLLGPVRLLPHSEMKP